MTNWLGSNAWLLSYSWFLVIKSTGSVTLFLYIYIYFIYIQKDLRVFMYSTEHLVVKMAILKKYFCTESVSMEQIMQSYHCQALHLHLVFHITHTNTSHMAGSSMVTLKSSGRNLCRCAFMCRQLTIHCVFFG